MPKRLYKPRPVKYANPLYLARKYKDATCVYYTKEVLRLKKRWYVYLRKVHRFPEIEGTQPERCKRNDTPYLLRTKAQSDNELRKGQKKVLEDVYFRLAAQYAYLKPSPHPDEADRKLWALYYAGDIKPVGKSKIKGVTTEQRQRLAKLISDFEQSDFFKQLTKGENDELAYVAKSKILKLANRFLREWVFENFKQREIWEAFCKDGVEPTDPAEHRLFKRLYSEFEASVKIEKDLSPGTLDYYLLDESERNFRWTPSHNNRDTDEEEE